MLKGHQHYCYYLVVAIGILHAMNIIIYISENRREHTFGWVQYVNQMMRYLLKREN